MTYHYNIDWHISQPSTKKFLFEVDGDQHRYTQLCGKDAENKRLQIPSLT